jgi:hypothetical protein
LVFGRRGVCVQEWRSRRATPGKEAKHFCFLRQSPRTNGFETASLIGREAPTETR